MMVTAPVQCQRHFNVGRISLIAHALAEICQSMISTCLCCVLVRRTYTPSQPDTSLLTRCRHVEAGFNGRRDV